jgi:plastocyanin domain-containing protein
VSFVRTTDQTCATEVVFPDLGINQKLPLNQPVKVDVPTDAAKTLTFQCGMGMYKGSVVVTEKK